MKTAIETAELSMSPTIQPGIELPDGTFLTYACRRVCPCADCGEPFAIYRRAEL